MTVNVSSLGNQGDFLKYEVSFEYTDLPAGTNVQSTPILHRMAGAIVTGALCITTGASLPTVLPVGPKQIAAVTPRLSTTSRINGDTETMQSAYSISASYTNGNDAIASMLVHTRSGTITPSREEARKVMTGMLPSMYRVAIGGNLLLALLSGLSLLTRSLIPFNVAAILLPVCGAASISFALDWLLRGRH